MEEPRRRGSQQECSHPPEPYAERVPQRKSDRNRSGERDEHRSCTRREFGEPEKVDRDNLEIDAHAQVEVSPVREVGREALAKRVAKSVLQEVRCGQRLHRLVREEVDREAFEAVQARTEEDSDRRCEEEPVDGQTVPQMTRGTRPYSVLHGLQSRLAGSRLFPQAQYGLTGCGQRAALKASHRSGPSRRKMFTGGWS